MIEKDGPPGASRRWAGLLLTAPLSTAVSVVLSLALPPAGAILLPWAAARTARVAFASPTVFTGLVSAALTVPASLFLGLLLPPAGRALAPIGALLFVALPAAALFSSAWNGRRRDAVFLVVAATTGVGAFAVLLGAGLGLERDPGVAFVEALEPGLRQFGAYNRTLGLSEASTEAMEVVLSVARWLLGPQIVGMVGMLVVFYAALVAYPFGVFAGLDERRLGAPSFVDFTTPAAAAALFVPAGALAALAGGEVRRTATDVLLPLLALFFLRGLAIIRALLDRVRAGVLLRLLAYALALQMPLPLGVALGGLFDEFFDFRKRIASSGSGDEGSE